MWEETGQAKQTSTCPVLLVVTVEDRHHPSQSGVDAGSEPVVIEHFQPRIPDYGDRQ